jgi:hypothetical protein
MGGQAGQAQAVVWKSGIGFWFKSKKSEDLLLNTIHGN